MPRQRTSSSPPMRSAAKRSSIPSATSHTPSRVPKTLLCGSCTLYELDPHPFALGFILIVQQQVQVALVRIGCDLKLFNILFESSTPLTVADLSEKTGAAPTLLGKNPRREDRAAHWTQSNWSNIQAVSCVIWLRMALLKRQPKILSLVTTSPRHLQSPGSKVAFTISEKRNPL